MRTVILLYLCASVCICGSLLWLCACGRRRLRHRRVRTGHLRESLRASIARAENAAARREPEGTTDGHR